MPALTLTHPEATPAQLKAALASTKERRISLRLLALTKLQEGKSVSAIAEFFGVHRTMIPAWVKRVNAKGLDGLADRSGRGRRHRLTDEQRAALRKVLAHPPTDAKLTGTLWTGKLLKQYIEREYSVTYGAGLTAMYRLLRQLGFTLQRPAKRYRGANPDKQAEFQAVVKKNLGHGQERAGYRGAGRG